MRQLRWLSYFSLIYGGFLLLTYLAGVYFVVWRHETLPIFPGEQRRFQFEFNSSVNSLGLPSPRAGDRIMLSNRDPGEFAISQLLSLPMIGVLLTGIAFLANGYILMKYVSHKEIKDTRKFVISSLLTPEEKAVFDRLIRQEGEATQKQLSLSTGFSPVKTFRIIQRLEAKKIVTSHPFGMTKKIIINEKMEKN